jgi:predicted nuclease with TOPRIM domain
MDFKFLEFIKEIISDSVYASIAKIAVGFYCLKKLIQFAIKGLNLAFKTKEISNEYAELKKDVADLKIANIENKERDLKTHKLIENLQTDLTAYKKRTHKIENENVALNKLVEQNVQLLQKINDRYEKP